jgi:hypothetical protein
MNAIGRSRVDKLNDLDLFSCSIAVILKGFLLLPRADCCSRMQTNRLGDFPKEEPCCTLDSPGPNVVNLKVGRAPHLLVQMGVMGRQAFATLRPRGVGGLL